MSVSFEEVISRLGERELAPVERPATKAGLGRQVMSRCPAHGDDSPSLSLAQTTDGKILLNCFAGCTAEAVARALGLTLADLSPHAGETDWTPYGPAVAVYTYEDESGNLLFQVCRTAKKQFPSRRPDPLSKSVWTWDLKGVRRVLFRLPRVLEAIQRGDSIYVAEGEKDALRLEKAGVAATCNPGGAGKWKPEYSESLRGAKHVVIVADKDESGRRHALAVAASLGAVAAKVEIVEAKAGKDAFDHLEAGHALSDFVAIKTGEPDLNDETTDLREWPEPPAEPAFHGLAGEFVRLLAPHTEADPAGLLVQFLVAFGNAVGRCPYFVAEGDRHYTNLFAVLVGLTSKGRKGTSLGRVKAAFETADAEWVKNAITHGLVSGEGLIWAVRDPVEKWKKLSQEKAKQRGSAYETVIEDPGITDKRLMVIEAEFSRVLRVLRREGNTLSAVIRCAWDTGDLRSMNKNEPARATGAHVSIVAHVTRQELVQDLDSTEAANGFGNRFLWTAVRRSKLLPKGGRPSEGHLLGLQQTLSERIQAARTVRAMERDEEADARWVKEYEELSAARPGILGAILGRAEAQVMRLACTYALLDGRSSIGLVHLEAAMALWAFCERSARFIFGDALGNPLADRLLQAIRGAPDGLSRARMREVLSGHGTKSDVDAALSLLHELDLAHRVKVPTGGRPTETWFPGGWALEARKARKALGEEEPAASAAGGAERLEETSPAQPPHGTPAPPPSQGASDGGSEQRPHREIL